MSDHVSVAYGERAEGDTGGDEDRPIPIGGLLSAWGALMATKSDDPLVQQRIRRQGGSWPD
jgi:hypothetical protein